MIISIVTLFPEMFIGVFDHSILKRAQLENHLQIHFVNIRDFADDHYKSVDDHPYGGGIGMIMRVDILDKAITQARRQLPKKKQTPQPKQRILLMSPQGIPLTQHKIRELATYDHLIIVSGHYEGVDERVRNIVDEEISIGDYILTGGEIPCMVLVDGVTRLLPGVLKKPEATRDESFTTTLIEYPQYTRPPMYKSMSVPSVLLSGNHKRIEIWRKNKAIMKTKKRKQTLLSIHED